MGTATASTVKRGPQGLVLLCREEGHAKRSPLPIFLRVVPVRRPVDGLLSDVAREAMRKTGHSEKNWGSDKRLWLI